MNWLQENREIQVLTNSVEAPLGLKETRELLVGLVPRDLKEPKEKRDKMELGSLGWSMSAGEGLHVPVVLR